MEQEAKHIYQYTTYCELTFNTPQYNGHAHYIYSRDGRLLAEIVPEGRLTIYKGYAWDVWRAIGEDVQTSHGESAMYLPSLVLDVLRQVYRHSHGLCGYEKEVVHKYYRQVMRECGLTWQANVNYTLVRIASCWRKVMVKWRC